MTRLHNRINRYLRGEKLSPRVLLENMRAIYQPSALGYPVFDDTIIDKSFEPQIETTRRYWQGDLTNLLSKILED